MDMDTTIKGISIDRDELEKILNEIILIDLDDHIKFKIKRSRIFTIFPNMMILESAWKLFSIP